MFSLMPILVGVVFVIVIVVFVVAAVRGAKQWRYNNAQPVLNVSAAVTAKRMEVSHHHHRDAGTHMDHTTSSTRYYATFEVQSGDRLELLVPDREYGMLAEGDRGELTFQGTRYLGFRRNEGG